MQRTASIFIGVCLLTLHGCSSRVSGAEPSEPLQSDGGARFIQQARVAASLRRQHEKVSPEEQAWRKEAFHNLTAFRTGLLSKVCTEARAILARKQTGLVAESDAWACTSYATLRWSELFQHSVTPLVSLAPHMESGTGHRDVGVELHRTYAHAPGRTTWTIHCALNSPLAPLFCFDVVWCVHCSESANHVVFTANHARCLCLAAIKQLSLVEPSKAARVVASLSVIHLACRLTSLTSLTQRYKQLYMVLPCVPKSNVTK